MTRWLCALTLAFATPGGAQELKITLAVEPTSTDPFYR